MKFTCDKSDLFSAIGTASRAAASKSPMPALEGLLVEATGSDVTVTGYDMKKGIYTSFTADVAEEGRIVLGARILGEIVRNLPDGEVTVQTREGMNTRISCLSSEYDILGVDPSDYPELPDVASQSGVGLPQKLLGEMIRQTLFAVSDNETRPVYTGELFVLEEGQLTVVAVDGYRLALRRETLEENTENCSFIVPGKALADLEKLCSDSDESVRILLGEKHISFTIDRTVLISRRLEGEFLDYKKSIPNHFGVNVTCARGDLQRAVERVSLIIDDRVKNPVRCVFSDDCIKISCATALGKADDICPVEGSGGETVIAFNNRYLLDALKAAPAEQLSVGLNNSSSPCVFSPVDESDKFLYMILPVRIRTEA